MSAARDWSAAVETPSVCAISNALLAVTVRACTSWGWFSQSRCLTNLDGETALIGQPLGYLVADETCCGKIGDWARLNAVKQALAIAPVRTRDDQSESFHGLVGQG